MNEHEYKEWFSKYLGDIESLNNPDIQSPLQNCPKPFNAKKWLLINSISLVLTLGVSLFFGYVDAINSYWIYSWISNALLNLSFGLIVSLFILIFTNQRDKNISFYNDIIPLLQQKYKNMHTAYYQYYFKIDRNFHKNDFQECYNAWHINSNTCFVIINFFEYLLKVLPFKPKSFSFNNEQLEEAKNIILEANNHCQEEFFSDKIISQDVLKECIVAVNIGGDLLSILQSFVQELEQILYQIKYNKKTIKDNEKYFDEY